MTIRSVLRLPQRLIRRRRRSRFFRQYPNIHPGSSLGTDGIGKGCTLEADTNLTVGEDSTIGPGSELLVYRSHFSRPLDAELIIGRHVRITARCRITCAGRITIGDDALFGPDVFITDHNHGMDPEAAGGYSPQDITIRNVAIGEGVWLGQRVCVLPGVTVGAHSIVGANSVVTRDIPPYSIAVGAPAKIIKKWNHDRKCWENV